MNPSSLIADRESLIVNPLIVNPAIANRKPRAASREPPVASREPPVASRDYVKFLSEMFRNSSEKSSISAAKCFTRFVK